MSTLQSYVLLEKLAFLSSQKQRLFSRVEIDKKINEIKYLASQKKIPRLTLRKEIIHLENKLKAVSWLEEELSKQKKSETVKVNALKKHITSLRKRMATAGDKDIYHKVEKLSFLLAECLAKKEVKKDIHFSENIGQAALSKKRVVNSPSKTSENRSEKIKKLQQRLSVLKEDIQKSKLSGNNPEKVRLLEEQVELAEEKIAVFITPHLEIPIIAVESSPIEAHPEESRHQLLFAPLPAEKTIEIDTEKELPLPPPPKRVVQK